ncbi:TPA: phage tail protein [Mannheimia haemolytica]|nr:phage tail protein [Mannheimia haemolytica]
MYFMLGNIAFEPVNLTEFSEQHTAEFAEHAVLKGKPRLQAMGEKLNELNFSLRLHHTIGGVESRYQALLEAKAKQAALALIWGSRYKGDYVIVDISSTTLFTDGRGNALAREMQISLKEFVGDNDGGVLGEALNFGGGSLLGSILPSGAVTTLSQIKTAVSRGVELYNSGKRLVDEVQNTVAIIRQLKNDPATALAYLPAALANLDGALGHFGNLTGSSATLVGLQEKLPAAVVFSEEIGEIYQSLQTMRSSLGNASANSWDNWFTPAESALTEVTDSFDHLAKPVAKMTAWIVLRTDEEAENDTVA